MLFNSLQFLVFFPVVTVFYFLLPHRFRWFLLLAASCLFYCAFYAPYLLILLFTIVIDFVAGIYIEKSDGAKRKRFLIMSIIANVGVLAVFKYYNFFISNYNDLAHLVHMQGHDLGLWNVLLPIGLSFHTFQAMSYTIEVYRGKQKAERHFGIYALYVMFYPQLVAGPIERPQQIIHQFYEEHHFDLGNLWWGLRLMLWGLFKKVVIADRLSYYINAMYKNPHVYHQGNVMMAAIFFSFQIYCDFSGYSDIAIGAARVMGFNLMRNFDRPYLATNIGVFWRRWHISLSTWFRDYFYISLGGNRVSLTRRNLNLFYTFLLSGLWHGANWTFIIWGGIHGLFMISYNYLTSLFKSPFKIPTILDKVSNLIGIIFTFSIVTIAWIFFRANNVSEAIDIIHVIFGSSTQSWFEYPVIQEVRYGESWFNFVVVLITTMLLSEEVLIRNGNRFTKNEWIDSMWLGIVIFLILTMGVFNQNSFIYFQF